VELMNRRALTINVLTTLHFGETLHV